MITDVTNGILSQQTQMRKGFIILSINDNVVRSAEDVQKFVVNNKSSKIAGKYPGDNSIYYYGLNFSNPDYMNN